MFNYIPFEKKNEIEPEKPSINDKLKANQEDKEKTAVAKTYKYKGEDLPLLNKYDLLSTFKNIPDDMQGIRDKAIIAFLWLACARASEATSFRKRDLIITKEQYDPRTKDYFNEPKLVYIFRLNTMKNKVQKNRQVGVFYDSEPELIDHFMAHYNIIPNDEDRLFPLTPNMVWYICKKRWLGFRAHHIRHSKASWLAGVQNFDIPALQVAAGWKTANSATPYIHLNYKKSLY